MPSGDIWKLDVVTSQQGVNAANIFYWKQIGETNNPANETTAVRDAFQDTILFPWKSMVSNRVTFSGMRIQRWQPKAILPTIVPFTGEVGLIDAEPLQSTKAALMAIYTTEVSARGRGRMFFMGIPETAVQVNQFQLLTIGTLETLVDAFGGIIQASGDTATFKMGVWSATDEAFYDATNTVARPTIYQQRSRQAEGL